MKVKAPRDNERRVDEASDRKRSKSVIWPPYMRRSPKVTEADSHHSTVPLANVWVKKRARISFPKALCTRMRERSREKH